MNNSAISTVNEKKMEKIIMIQAVDMLKLRDNTHKNFLLIKRPLSDPICQKSLKQHKIYLNNIFERSKHMENLQILITLKTIQPVNIMKLIEKWQIKIIMHLEMVLPHLSPLIIDWDKNNFYISSINFYQNDPVMKYFLLKIMPFMNLYSNGKTKMSFKYDTSPAKIPLIKLRTKITISLTDPKELNSYQKSLKEFGGY